MAESKDLDAGKGRAAPVTYRIGADIGGTFTDLVLLGSDGRLLRRKVSSTPDDYGRAIIEGAEALLREAEATPGQLEDLVHATTVVTNTVLEGKGARTALVTTAGFRDLLEMRRLRIPEMYNLQYDKPAPLVPRRRCLEVSERLGPGGVVWQPLDEASVEAVAERLAAERVEAVAIALLHAYANPEHEIAVEALLRARLGEAVYIARSSSVLPEVREYERASTTVVSAYVGPVVQRYLGRLSRQLAAAGISAPLRVVQSNGGAMTAEAAVGKPAQILESGPAAGVIACAGLARALEVRNAISFDMGGTTAKAAIIEDGEPARTTEYEVGAGINLSSKLVKGGGYAVKLPFIDVSEIGAGGGSIVSLGPGGSLRVGPQSAGSVPGPVCYGAGGEQPTFTDAVLTLGYLNQTHLVGGALPIDAARAREALTRLVAAPLERPLLETAFGIFRLAAVTMTRAVKAVTTYRGRDPRDFTLFAFGGNGPVVAAAIARELQIGRVVIPPAPGVFSAFGLPFSEIEHEFQASLLVPTASLDAAGLRAAFAALEAKALAGMAAEGFAAGRVTLSRAADLRYEGQAYELTVPVPDDLEPRALELAFAGEHRRTYGHGAEDDPMDLVNIKVTARGDSGRARRYQDEVLAASPRPLPTRPAYFGPEHGLLDTPVLTRGDLATGPVTGPAIVEEYDSTCIVPPGCRLSLGAAGSMIIELGELS